MDTVPMKSTGDFHEIRRKDRILDGERAVELLQTAEYGYLSLGESDNGYAYGVPLNFAYDPEGNALYFHCMKASSCSAKRKQIRPAKTNVPH